MGRRCGRRRRLLFRSGYYLTIQPDGSVKGTKQKDCPYGKFTFCSFVYSMKKKVRDRLLREALNWTILCNKD